MASLEKTSAEETQQVIAGTAARAVPTTVTVRAGTRWVVFTARAVAAENGSLWLAMPAAIDGDDPEPLLGDQEVGISFRVYNHRYFFSTRVTGFETHQRRDGSEVPAVLVIAPTEMEKLGRRAYTRADVPSGCIARAVIWPGGHENQSEMNAPERPVWAGKITNLSAGGFQIRTEASGLSFFEPGDIIGARLTFGSEGKPIETDAQFRYGSPDGSMSLLGFRFLGLGRTPDGMAALETIAGLVKQFLNA